MLKKWPPQGGFPPEPLTLGFSGPYTLRYAFKV